MKKLTKEISLLDINDKLNKLIAMIAIQNRTKDEQIEILTKLEYSVEEICLFTGIPNRTVIRKRAKIRKD
jgi:hypothetical protein